MGEIYKGPSYADCLRYRDLEQALQRFYIRYKLEQIQLYKRDYGR